MREGAIGAGLVASARAGGGIGRSLSLSLKLRRFIVLTLRIYTTLSLRRTSLCVMLLVVRLIWWCIR
jgi:hypothetical protein